MNSHRQPSSNGETGKIGKVAYIVSAFPALPETFVLYEIVEMEKLGVPVELYPLRRLRSKLKHPEADPWMKRAHYRPFLSFGVLRSQFRFLRRGAIRYFKTFADVLWSTWGSADFFFGAVVIFPKAVLFADEMMKDGIAHVHAQFANHAATAAFIIHRLTGIPFSFTARGTDIQVDRHMLKEKLEEAEFAIAVSADNKRLMRDECGARVADKTHVIHGGVNVDRLAPRARIKPRPFRILCIARFEEVKGHTFLVEACRLLRQRNVGFECYLVGEGPLLPAIEKQIRRSELHSRVFLLGACTYPDVLAQLEHADVVVLPTAPTANGKREGIPNVLKEAMACGLPVVASLAGGIPELVDDGRTGVLVQPKDSLALAEALECLSNDERLCHRLGSAGREKVVQEFNLKISTALRAQLFLGGRLGEKAYGFGAKGMIEDLPPVALQSK